MAHPVLPSDATGAAHEDAIRRGLGFLAVGLAGRPLRLQALQVSQADTADTPAARPVLTPTHLLLPINDSPIVHKAAVAHAAAHLLYSKAGQPAHGLKPMTLAVMSAVEDARVERLLIQENPGLRHWIVPLLRQALRPHALDAGALIARMDLALADPAYADDNYWVNKARTLFEAEPNLHADAAYRRIASLLANDLGQMRVPFRATHYAVPASYRDDNSFLWVYPHDAAVPPPQHELEAQQSTPRQNRTHANAGDSPPPPLDEIELRRSLYPEWDQQRDMLRQRWCTVIDKQPAWQAHAAQASTVNGPRHESAIRLQRARGFNRERRLRRQWEGPDLDLDAAVEVVVDQRTQGSGEARIFVRAPQEDRSASILMLLDLSASTNDPCGDGCQSFLQIEKHAAMLLAEAAMAAGDRVAIHGFSSNTRAEVSYYHLLEFGAPLDSQARSLVLGAPGRHSTRMGAALRHATDCLQAQTSDLRAILLVTDGAPSDIDVYRPGYLVEDARHAVHAARASAIQVQGLAMDQAADDYVRRIFGWRGFQILDEPAALAPRLQAVYRQLTGR